MISDKLVWIDIETTGVDEKVDLILEIAVIVTDNQLNELGLFSSIVGSCNPNLLIENGKPDQIDNLTLFGLTKCQACVRRSLPGLKLATIEWNQSSGSTYAIAEKRINRPRWPQDRSNRSGNWQTNRYKDSRSSYERARMGSKPGRYRIVASRPCPDCNGSGLQALSHTVPCWGQHFESGLIDTLKFAYDQGVLELSSIEMTEDRIINFLANHEINASNSTIETCEGAKDVRPPLCGSSVHFDRQFLNRDMPRLMKLIHYRNIDVSGIRECARRFSPNLEIPEAESSHRATDDLRDSINLLRFFRNSGFLGI